MFFSTNACLDAFRELILVSKMGTLSILLQVKMEEVVWKISVGGSYLRNFRDFGEHEIVVRRGDFVSWVDNYAGLRNANSFAGFYLVGFPPAMKGRFLLVTLF